MEKELKGKTLLKYDNKVETLEYYILKSSEKIVELDTFSYGIEVVKRNGNEEETKTIKDLTVNKNFAEDVIEKLKNNLVTPIHLNDVLENLL